MAYAEGIPPPYDYTMYFEPDKQLSTQKTQSQTKQTNW